MLGEIAKNTALALPWIRRRRAGAWLRAGCNDESDTAAYVRGVFDKHRAAVERHRPVTGAVLEIGPGPNLATAALFVQAGADEAVGIDVVPWAHDTPLLYQELNIDRSTLNRVRYECPCPIETAAFPEASFDIIYSHACFQKFADPRAATQNIARMLRPGGVTTHQIDLRDNRDLDRPLDFLTISDRMWKLATSRRSPTNRWRASDITNEFREAGLKLLEVTVTRRTDVSAAAAASFSPRFRSKSVDDLGILGLFLVAAKLPFPSNQTHRLERSDSGERAGA